MPSASQQEPLSMATAATTHHHHHHPSLSALSETSSASTHVSYSAFPFYANQPPPLNTPRTSSVSGSRNTKGLVLTDGRIPTSPVQSIRRKPLSSTASAIATRYSSGEHLANAVKGLPRPEQRYDRAFSVDSPTVYEFPHAPVQPMSRPPRWEPSTKPIPGARDIVLPEVDKE